MLFMPIEERNRETGPQIDPPRDRDIHLVELISAQT